jgi:hypothetical protein
MKTLEKNLLATVKKFQDINGNTYHAVRVSIKDSCSRIILSFKRYGYGTHYEETTLEELEKIGFCGIEKNNIHFFDLGYGLKRDMVEWSRGGCYNKN